VSRVSVYSFKNSASSASLKSSVAEGTCRSLSQKPSRLQRFRTSPDVHDPPLSTYRTTQVHAGEQYVILETTVSRNTSCNEAGGMS